ncbi:universal stress protein [Dactylosporangium fulvum]|uniref:Universal stress protein n=1 Tax=Dactylosporangium fulvum TaxID=53359 RepID=A0ABY5VQM3_9ACTN|nr:universal stress protein [Dactylosporangium fulvum]UWP79590.1 universal stress protein [Dactylosporangium fulvum]
MYDGTVVVGVDGGEPSLLAARWAVLEAARRAVPLRVLLAYRWRVPLTAFAPGGELAETAQQLADMMVEDVAREVSTVAPEVVVQAAAVPGHPADVLVKAGAGAALVVVGTRGRRAATGALLGSVSQQVAIHATCPVAVVRGRPDAAGDVLVGIDGSESSGLALALAFDEARQRGRGLVAVRAIETPIVPLPLGTPPLLHDSAEVQRALADEAAGQVAAAGKRCPDVPWEFHGVEGEAADVLVDRSRQAQLVVVGSRGRGGFAGLLLGSVGMRLLHRSHCPVLIAHGPPGTAPPAGRT